MAIILFFPLILVACSAIPNYLEPHKPRFEGNYGPDMPENADVLRVVSYNIQYGKNIQAAIQDLSQLEEIRGADIVLLQEMDDQGVEELANTLGYNYVYFPASIHSHHRRNFGNAILSKWPIESAKKLILPHANPKNQQRRIAVKAHVIVNGAPILTYSVHTETFWLRTRRREEQVDVLLDDIEQSCHADKCQRIIVGGDFNTLTPSSVVKIDQKFSSAGLERATKGIGATVNAPSIRIVMDQIYTLGLEVIATGKSEQATASDHYPVWTTLKLEE